jgi:hypothetical protein
MVPTSDRIPFFSDWSWRIQDLFNAFIAWFKFSLTNHHTKVLNTFEPYPDLTRFYFNVSVSQPLEQIFQCFYMTIKTGIISSEIINEMINILCLISIFSINL